nr:PREDICTED: uncharacterized protein LOC109029600 [Bemisia tabaci]
MPGDGETSNATRLKTLRRQRGHVQSAITSFEKVLNNWRDNGDDRDADYLQVSLESVQKTFEKLEPIQDELEELDEENETPRRENLQTSFNLVVARARKYLRETSLANSVAGSSQSEKSNNSDKDSSSLPVKLPTIRLPKFDGSIEQWASFYDLFTSLIDENPDLSRVTKLQYLRLSLSENAAKLIQYLETTDDNYEIALSLLKNKFDSPRRAMKRHWAILCDYTKLLKDKPIELGKLVDTFNQHLRALENLGAPVDQWSVPVISLILSKISSETAEKWEFTLKDNSMPPYSNLLNYLEKKAHSVDFSTSFETSSSTTEDSSQGKQKSTKNSHQRDKSFSITKSSSQPNSFTKLCVLCTDKHPLYLCEKFKKKTTDERRKFVSEKSLCFNCLKANHGRDSCRCPFRCKNCGDKHNTLLCLKSPDSTESSGKNGASFLVHSMSSDLITTAIVDVVNQSGHAVQCRTLLDTGSTTNFMSERLAKRLGLVKAKFSQFVDGLNGIKTVSKGLVDAVIQSRCSGYKRELSFHVVETISNFVPDQPINRRELAIPANLKLADPDFHRPAPLEMILSSGVTLSLFCKGQITLSDVNIDLFLQKTLLGWVIGGRGPSNNPAPNPCCHLTTLNFDLANFWTMEEEPKKKFLTDEEAFCEDHFKKNVTRNENGRYCVALPFNERLPELGESRDIAYKRFLNTKRRLAMNPELEKQYNAVMQEYIDLGHMSPVEGSKMSSEGYFLPHHAVIKTSSLTTALRVVFDGSAQSSTGISLNDTLSNGPVIQPDLFTQLLNFRRYPVVVTADLEKMYRQVLVRPEDRKYQQIFWQNSEGKIVIYQLNTVTFGLTPAPFLSIRCLHQLSDDEGEHFPLAAKLLKENFYVDDALLNFKNVETAKQGVNQLTGLLMKGQFNARSFASNVPEVLKGIPPDKINRHLILNDTSTIGTLGVKWDSSNDSILYCVDLPDSPRQVTKRIVLSEISKIFDPLGLVGPVIITAKIIIQDLWKLKLGWDESLPMSLHSYWQKYRRQLQSLNDLSFDRKAVINEPTNIQIHGFSDASEKAYGVCVYLRSENAEKTTQVSLLCAKSRVAPVKVVSIPRLELCGALLLTNLIDSIKNSMKLPFDGVTYWTDSTVVLNWLQTSPARLKTYVANRASEIQTKTESNEWRKVKSCDNPADLISRGLMPKDFENASIWQQGPQWLSQPEETWPVSEFYYDSESIEEVKASKCFHYTHIDISLFEKYSSIFKLQRIIAYCMRVKRRNYIASRMITVPEMNEALKVIVRQIQRASFPEEIRQLEKGENVRPQNRLSPLTPFLDKEGILRVGGRLQNAALPFSQRHPMLIPKTHHVTRLLIEAEHQTNAHAGVQSTLYALRRRFWVIDGRNTVRKIIRQCVCCSKLSPPSPEYLMGNLPTARVQPARPFTQVGVDYCGYFYIKEKKYRNRNKLKVYVAVFVCLATKAVHLELVSDLTTVSFIEALRRFIARRGLPADIFSDNATNFVGAKNQLKELYTLLSDQKHQTQVSAFSLKYEIQWHFIPARSPNFGGLWEAAVKSFKHHLHRVIGTDLFTYDEFTTFLYEIEAVLNSRPLTPISSDPNDLLVLTPGHFLIGDSLKSLPHEDFRDVKMNRLSTWQHIQQAKQHFWARWSREYLNELTVRHKWTKNSPNIKEGTLVMLKEDNVPPLNWPLGRVVQCHPGKDGVTRVVTVKTAQNTLKRNVRNVAPLPIDSDESERN